MPEQWNCATVGRLSGLVCASVPCSVSQELRATTVTASETVGEPNRDHCRSYDQTVGSKGNERREEIAMEASEGQGAVWTGAPRRLFGAKAPPRAGKTVGIVLWDCRCPGPRRKSQGRLVHATSRAGNRVAPTLGKQPHSVKRWVICSQNGGVAPLSTCIRVSPTNNDRIMPFIFVMVGCERSAPAPPAGNEEEWSWSWQLSVSLPSMFASGVAGMRNVCRRWPRCRRDKLKGTPRCLGCCVVLARESRLWKSTSVGLALSRRWDL